MPKSTNIKKRQFGPTQKDIAQALGISQATVGYALNPQGATHRISPETVERIHAKAQEMGYRSQRFASILRKGRSYTIGVVFMTGDYHAPQGRVRDLVKGAIQAGYQLIAVDMGWFSDGQSLDARAVQNYLVDQAVEGVILCNVMRDREGVWEQFFKERSLPALALSSTAGGPIDQVGADVESAYCEMTAHHMAEGSQNLELLLASSARSRSLGISLRPLQHRAAGFARAIRAAGGALHLSENAQSLFDIPASSPGRKGKRLVGTIRVESPLTDDMDLFDFGFHHTVERLSAGGPLADSILCSNDQMACGVLSAYQRHGIVVPAEVRISGMDDAPYARYCGVPISTIAQPSEEMTRWAINRIVELIESPAERESPRECDFPCSLVIRQSTVASLDILSNLRSASPVPSAASLFSAENLPIKR